MNGSFGSRMMTKLKTIPLTARLLALLGDPLYRNSLYILVSSVTASVIGLVFWIIAANFYPISTIGIAATLISTSSLLASIASLGLDQGMIRYFPTHDKSMIYGTVVKITVVCSVLVGLVFIMGSSIWMPELVVSGSITFLFTGIVCCMSIATMTYTAFVGQRMAKHALTQNILLGVRLVLLVLFVGFGSLGILVALIVSYIIALPISARNLTRSGIRLGHINWAYLRESLWFSTGSYIGFIFANLPYLSLPLIAFSLLGSAEAAVYYMALSISSIIFLIPAAMVTSLFVEGSHGENLGRIVKKSAIVIYGVLIPLVLVFMFFEQWLLGILGQEYVSQGTGILRLMVISSLFVASFMLENTIMKIKGKIKGVIASGVVNSLSFIGLSFLLASTYGAGGISFAWMSSYIIASIFGFVLILGLRERK